MHHASAKLLLHIIATHFDDIKSVVSSMTPAAWTAYVCSTLSFLAVVAPPSWARPTQLNVRVDVCASWHKHVTATPPSPPPVGPPLHGITERTMM